MLSPPSPPQPGGRDPAPGPLRIIQDFVNTFDVDADIDRISTANELAAWLIEHGLLGPSDAVTADDHRAAILVREAIRELLLANAGEVPDREAVSVINSAAEDAWFALTLALSDQVVLTPRAPGVAGAVGRILAASFLSMLDGTWGRLKACRNPSCEWAFFDWSRNRSGVWCTMSECGNREKARRFRRRRRSPKEEGL